MSLTSVFTLLSHSVNSHTPGLVKSGPVSHVQSKFGFDSKSLEHLGGSFRGGLLEQ